MKKKIVIGVSGLALVAAVLMAVFILKGNEKAPPIPAPESYGEAANLVAALPAGEDVTVTQQFPEEEGDEEESEDGEAQEPQVQITMSYVYDGMEDPIQALTEYSALLTGEEYGFVPVDSEMKEIELPALEGKKGSLMLVHPLDDREHQEGEVVEGLFSLRLNWSGKQCSVEVCQVPSELVELIQPPVPEPLSVTEIIGYMYGFTPSKLGLEGNSMMEYQVLAMDGTVMVGGVPCLQMNVYGEDPDTGTNELAGKYFFSNQDRSLYSLVAEGQVRKLEL